MKPQKEPRLPYGFYTLIVIVITTGICGILFFTLGTYNYQKTGYQQGYINGTQDTLIGINNQMVYGLATYGEYRSNVFYQNQSIPIKCEVLK